MMRLLTSTLATAVASLAVGCLPPPPPADIDDTDSSADDDDDDDDDIAETADDDDVAETDDDGDGDDDDDDDDDAGSTTGGPDDDTGDSGERGSATGDDTGGDARFAVPYEGPCVDLSAGEHLSDYVAMQSVESCVFHGVDGDGTVPPDLLLRDAPNCDLIGDFNDFQEIYEKEALVETIGRVGTWAFMVEVTRDDGATAWVPHCYSRGPKASTAYDFIIAFDTGQHDLTAPTERTFTPGAFVDFGGGEPRFHVTDEEGCFADGGAGCDGQNVYAPAWSASPLGEPSLNFVSGDADDMVWSYALPGGVIPASWTRPFVVQADLHFCLEQPSSFCTAPGNIAAHGRGPLSYSVIFRPEQ